jgi:nucleoside-diphosphate-sugar epimerase
VPNLNSIFLTGSTGFVGKNFLSFFENEYSFHCYKKNENIHIQEDFVLHFAGKAHDIKNVIDSKDYYEINLNLTKKVFNNFLSSKAKVFFFLSSVKAVANDVKFILTEDITPIPTTHYGKSKLLAENYILSKKIPNGKRVYILRPCMIHGPGNKGNLNLLFKIVTKGIPWPLGKFENKRSFCSIDNLFFIIKELIDNEKILSGVYNVADDEPLSTNELICLISESQNKKPLILNIPQSLIKLISKLGTLLMLPLNTERLCKLTETYVVSNNKIKKAINKELPINAKHGLMKTFNSFNKT